MSVKSIERRLCCGFYDMAWLNLAAGIENLPEEDTDVSSGALRSEWLSAAIPMAKTLAGEESVDPAEGTGKLLALREEIAASVEALARCRAEATVLRKALARRAAGERNVVPVDTDEEVRSLLANIFAGNDPMMMNLRVQSMVSAFPARMTKTKFYDLIAGYLSLYNGQEDGYGLESFCYRIRSAAAIGEDAGAAENAAVAEAKAVLAKASAVAVSETSEGAEEMSGTLAELCGKLDANIGLCESIVRCINPMAAIGILSGVQEDLAKDSSVEKELCPAVLAQLLRAGGENVDEASYERLTAAAHDAMERFFEPLSVMTEQETGRLQSAIDAMDDETAAAYIPVMKAARLMSTSAFASLSEEVSPKVTPEQVDACRDELYAQLEARFEGLPKSLVREWMASVLSELPVWFENRSEVMEYMLAALRGCRTDGERRYAISELRKSL